MLHSIRHYASIMRNFSGIIQYFITVRLWRDGTISDMDTVKHSTADAGELLHGSIRSRFM